MLGNTVFNVKAVCQVTAQVGPVFKGGGTCNRGFSGIVRTAGGNYSLTTDSSTPLVTTANASSPPDFPMMQLLQNHGAATSVDCGALITAVNTVVCQTATGGALAEADFALIIFSLS